MPIYATAADATAYIDGLVIDDAVAFDALLERAERDVDNVLGPIPIRSDTGLKLDPTELFGWEANALAAAVCAQAEHRLNAGVELGAPAKTSVKGPAFEVVYAQTGGTGLIGPKVALELGRIQHLRGLRARARA